MSVDNMEKRWGKGSKVLML